MDAPQAADAGTLRLDGALTIHRATEVHALLRERVEAGVGTLDLSAVTECDTAGLQLLLSLRRSLHDRGLTLKLAAVSPAVHEVLERCGATTALA